MSGPPKIDNAPGLKWKPIKAGWQARWRPRGDLVKRGYPFPSIRIWESTTTNPEPDEISKSFIADRCQTMQADMLLWNRANSSVAIPEYDGTWASLVKQYQTDTDSPYHKKEYATRNHYDTLCERVILECGSMMIANTDARMLLRLYENVLKPDKEGPRAGEPKISMAHAVIGMMRTITTFGATLLKCQACRLIRSDLRDMRIKNGKPREVHLSADQVIAVRKAAHEMGRHSIALANALQFDVASGVRQKDIIGEWIPLDEPGPLSDIVSGDMRWVKGIRGEEIDENFIWKHVTSKRKKLLVADLTLAPMVMEEFRMMAGLRADEALERRHVPLNGPLIINEPTGTPYMGASFRSLWREIARKAGVPDEIRNMDSRSGAVTEAFAAGAPADAIQKGATHATPSMTSRYNRGEAAAIATVMQFRASHRNKGGK